MSKPAFPMFLKAAFSTLISALLLLTGAAMAETCSLTGTRCVDATPCKPVQGLTVCLASLGQTCWRYEKEYTCYPDALTSTCSALESTPGCGQFDSRCDAHHPVSGECTAYTNKFDCDRQLPAPLPEGVIYLGTDFEIIKDHLNESACLPLRTSSTCWRDSGPTCLEPGATREINGLAVTRDCWRYEEVYACEDPTGVSESTCTELETDPACTEKGASVCVETLPSGVCSHYERTFSCVLEEGRTESVSNCADQKFCMDMGGGNIMCFRSGSPADEDFASTITALETVRQMGYYLDEGTMTVFNGEGDQCREGYFGLQRCCKTKNVSGTSNNAAVSGGMIFASVVGDQLVNFAGSFFVHDLLMSVGTPTAIMTSIYGVGTGGAPFVFGGNFTVYGLKFTYTSSKISFTGFNPYMFAASVAMHLLMELISCDDAEMKLSMKRGAGLCEYVGSYCSKKVLGSCVERKKGFCCYNSRLAKIISVEGRKQLGRGFGPPSSPDCAGFTAAEIELIDFSAIDFSEFYGEILKNMPDDKYARSRATEQMQNYYDSGTTDLNRNYYTSGTGLPKP